MKTNTLQFRRIVRMAAVGGEIRDRLPAVAGQMLDSLVAGIASVNDLTGTMYSGQARIREVRRMKKFTRSALKSELDAIWRTARAVALDQVDLDPEKFRPGRGGDETLLAAARSALRDLEPLTDEFVAHAMPPEFLGRLRSRLGDFEGALSESAASRRIMEDLKREFRRTMREMGAVALRLDAAVHNALGHDRGTIAGWKSATALRRPRRSRRVTAKAVGLPGATTEDVSNDPAIAAADPRTEPESSGTAVTEPDAATGSGKSLEELETSAGGSGTQEHSGSEDTRDGGWPAEVRAEEGGEISGRSSSAAADAPESEFVAEPEAA